MSTLRLQIITPRGKVFDNDVSYASFPGTEGEFGVMPGHATLVTLLSPGVIELTKNAHDKEAIAINWGYAEITEHHATVLVDGAVVVAGSTSGEVQAALEKAEKLFQDATDSSGLLQASAARLRQVAPKF